MDFKEKPELKNYFDSLPKMIQECIMQSGVQFDSKQEMESFCSRFDHQQTL